MSLCGRRHLFHCSHHLLSWRYSSRDTCTLYLQWCLAAPTSFPATATSSKRCHHSRLMALPDVGTFYSALFEGEDLWDHRLCLGHTLRGAVIATPDGDISRASLLLTGLRGGPPDALRGRMLHRFRADDMAAESPFWNAVQREAAVLLPPTPCPQASLSSHLLWALAGMLWKTRQASRPGMPSSLSPATSLPHVDFG